MTARGRKVGLLGFLLSVGAACTQLFGDQPNTLAPVSPSQLPAAALPLPTGNGPVAALCLPGQTRCDGALLRTCADDGLSWVTFQRCAAAALCQSDPAVCLSATCGADEMTCAGSALQRCNADRTGWDLFDTCLSAAHCNAAARQCQPEPCTAGQRRCDRSEADQSPVLEVCREDRLDWGPLDACVTRELCDQTLTSGSAGGLVVGSDGMVEVQAPASPETVLTCNLPACAVGETRCEGAVLQFCSEGRTGWLGAEECASEALCSASTTNLNAAGTPECVPPACGVGQHQCTLEGVLQLCREDRTGFTDLETCIGAPFCNAVLADQGQSGCRDAPCEAGEMQCNGAQIQVCRADRTALDNTGLPCESSALCNTSDAFNAFCDEPACRRGATSGSEFRCEGAELQRCNEFLTGYDTTQTCATPALCDASQRANGCRPPVCQPGQNTCNGGFLQACNADRTGFDNRENCGSQAQCDANAGRCADPCEPGATRCNTNSGDLEACRDRLTGWQPIADCQSLQLCDEQNGRCNICLPEQFSCADGQLRQCGDGRTFRRQNIPAECALDPNTGGGGIRACNQNNQVVVNPCPLGCTNGRCHECFQGQTQCVGNGQIRSCVNGSFGAPTPCSDGNACNGVESCVNNQCVGGTPPNCNDNNQCTNDSCSPATGCQRQAFSTAGQCVNNGSQVQACANGQLQLTNCSAFGCTQGRCNNCNQGQCATGTQFQTCDNGLLSAARSCPAGQVCQGGGNCVFNCAQVNCNDNNPCTNDTCSAQAGCQNTAVQNRTQCMNGAIQSCTNGNFTSQNCANGCNAGSTTCNTCSVNTAPTCVNGQVQSCLNGRVQNTNCGAGETCQGGECVRTQVCAPNSTRCQGNVPQRCNAAGSNFEDVNQCINRVATRCENGVFIQENCPADFCTFPLPADGNILAPPPPGTARCAPATTGSGGLPVPPISPE